MGVEFADARVTMSERHATPLPPRPVTDSAFPDPPISRTGICRSHLRPVVRAVPRTKTSIDIMNERDAFRARVGELEETLRTVQRETELALRFSEIQLLTLCRISCIARRAVGENRENGENGENGD